MQGIDLPDLVSIRNSTGYGIPNAFAVDQGYPLATIWFDRMIRPGAILTIVYNKAIPACGINDSIASPPEYSDLFVTGLARRLCAIKAMAPRYADACNVLWNEAKERVQRNNLRRQLPMLGLGQSQGIMDFNAFG